MRKLTTIFFLSIYLFSATEISQLLKVPKLIEHINAHNISIREFLSMHYGQETDLNADYTEDMKLPFKTENNTVALTGSTYYPLFSTVTLIVPTTYTEKNSYLIMEQFIHSSYRSNIWQPPKSV